MPITTFPSGLTVRTHPPAPKAFDPLKASEADLARHGFPPRPSDDTLLLHWKRVVRALAETTFIEPEFQLTDRQHEPIIQSGVGTSKNWSGAVVSLPPGSGAENRFTYVQGRWSVPRPSPAAADARYYASASWIGIDGSGSPDVLQAGVECDAENDGSEVVVTLYAWWEWFPENEIRIANLPISVGDVIICMIFPIGREQATIAVSNITTKQAAYFTVKPPDGTSLVGNCAEWIVERPKIGGSLSQLANYGAVTFDEAVAGTNLPGPDSVRHPSQGEINDMIGDDGSIVSHAVVVGQNQVTCVFE
jgi:hypothetical protein